MQASSHTITNYNFDVPSLVCIHDHLLELMLIFRLDTVNTVSIAKIKLHTIATYNKLAVQNHGTYNAADFC